MGARLSAEEAPPQRHRTLSDSGGGTRNGSGHASGRSYGLPPVGGGGAAASAAVTSGAVRVPGGGGVRRNVDVEIGGGSLSGLLLFQPRSLPSHLFAYRSDVSCPVCRASILVNDIENHLIVCLNKPRVAYNNEILATDKGECAICLEDLAAGNHVARLPCLCVYHKACIDAWFQKQGTCPEHPDS